MEGVFRHNSSVIGRKNQAKFENDCISRSGHRFKITQPNLMILVSFSSAEDALSNDVKTYDIFARKVLKIRRSAFLGDTRYIIVFMPKVSMQISCNRIEFSLHVRNICSLVNGNI